MHDNLTNLLPEGRQRSLLRRYYLRMGVVALMLATALTLAAGALLVPVYVFLGGSERAKSEQLAASEAKLAPADDAAFSARLAALSKNVSALLALSKNPSVSALLGEALALPRPGITLSGFSYTPAAPKAPATLTISGSSRTRDALRNYQLALQNAPFASAATLPVSAFAEDTDIPFTITATIAP